MKTYTAFRTEIRTANHRLGCLFVFFPLTFHMRSNSLETHQRRSKHCLHWPSWVDSPGSSGMYRGGPAGPSRTLSFSDALVIVQHLLVAWCSNCTHVDGAFLSKSLSRLPEVTLGNICGIFHWTRPTADFGVTSQALVLLLQYFHLQEKVIF